MRVAILAGGVGSRLAEETERIPKPMVEIGDRPILWHILSIYARQGHTDFVIALGYKGEVIKRWAMDRAALAGDLTVNLGDGRVDVHDGERDEWTIDLIDTGQRTQTGGRIKRLGPHLDDETFMLTWGDGVADIDLDRLLSFHRSHGKLVTMTVVRPQARFGHVTIEGDEVVQFDEKPQTEEGWINGAFFVVEPKALEYIDGDQTQWEREPLQRLAADGQLMAYRHESFWQCMDTLRDKKLLDDLCEAGDTPWLG